MNKLGIEVLSLSGMDRPGVESLRVLSDVILSDESGLVASGLQQLGEGGDRGVERLDLTCNLRIAANAVDVAEGSGEDSCARGGAQGVGRATTSAVVSASILILASDYIITELFFSK